MQLSEFLLARIAEDEADQASTTSAAWHHADCEQNTYDAGPCNCGLPARVLAECEAKRRIVEMIAAAAQSDDDSGDAYAHMTYGGSATALAAANILNHLAVPYADHPDYDEAWRP